MTEIRIQFREVPGNMFCEFGGCPEANQLVIRVQPDEAIHFRIVSKVPGLVSPGSSSVKRQAEQEGLDRLFRDAGLEWADSGCSMCVGINGDVVAPGERCASTTNRNFRGRQGAGARTHIMSPAMVAAAAVSGHLADMRPLLRKA